MTAAGGPGEHSSAPGVTQPSRGPSWWKEGPPVHGRQAQGQTVLSAPFSVSAGKLAPHNLSLTPHMLLLTPQLKLVPTPQSLADLQPPLIQRTQREGSSGPRPQRARSFPFLPRGTSSPRPTPGRHRDLAEARGGCPAEASAASQA